ncbi:MAG: hypothetical protein QOE80_912 [Actinomycetota bacterium]|jgi:hypothetical protein|nr:hypothetical protein [Actinomycetota bacterium]
MIVTVDPPAFALVDFDAGRIAALAADVAALVGVPDDLAVGIDVDEKNPFGKAWALVDGRSVTLSVEGGAFEDPQRLRQFSEAGTRLVLGRLLFRVADRFDPAFGDPPADVDLTKAEHAAWDAYSLGRYARRAGADGGRERRRYAFRIRHGFNDAADRAFDQLWDGSDLTWVDLRRICSL